MRDLLKEAARLREQANELERQFHVERQEELRRTKLAAVKFGATIYTSRVGFPRLIVHDSMGSAQSKVLLVDPTLGTIGNRYPSLERLLDDVDGRGGLYRTAKPLAAGELIARAALRSLDTPLLVDSNYRVIGKAPELGMGYGR